jgi:hypothetical protein
MMKVKVGGVSWQGHVPWAAAVVVLAGMWFAWQLAAAKGWLTP